MRIFTRADVLLISVLISTAALFLFIFYLWAADSGEIAAVYENGVLSGSYRLDRDCVINVYENGHITNMIEIKDRSVRVIFADCPDKSCVKQGAVSGVGQSVVCLPNRLFVTVNGKGGIVDGISK